MQTCAALRHTKVEEVFYCLLLSPIGCVEAHLLRSHGGHILSQQEQLRNLGCFHPGDFTMILTFQCKKTQFLEPISAYIQTK